MLKNEVRKLAEGVNGGNIWKCAFLHSEGSHSQPLHPIDTIVVPKCSWHWELPEHVPSFMWIALRAVHVNPNVVISMGKWLNPQVDRTPTTQPFSFILLQWYFFLIRINHKTIFQIGAVGDLVWRICGKKWGAPSGAAQNLLFIPSPRRVVLPYHTDTAKLCIRPHTCLIKVLANPTCFMFSSFV
jgi:hypothetical protein